MPTVDQKTVTIKVKTLIVLIFSLIGFTITLTSGAVYAWFGLSNKVDTNTKNIELMGIMLAGEIKKVYCVIDQQNQWHMHKKIPRFDCETR